MKPLKTSRSGRALPVLALALLAATGCPRQPAGGHDDHDHAPSGASERDEDGEHGEHAEHAEDGEHEEGVVRLTETQARSAKVQVQAAGPGTVSEVLHLRAIVAPNRDAQVHANPRVAGLVRAIHKGLGDRVEAGEVLCELDSVDLGQAASEYLQSRTRLAAQRELIEREREILTRSVALATTVLERERRLQEQQISTVRALYDAEQRQAEAELARDRRMLELEATIRGTEVEAAVARERLHVLGLTAAEIDALSATEGAGIGRYEIRAAAAGVIVERHITLNEFVDPEDTLFQLQDLSRVWIEGKVYEKDLRTVQTGQPARVAVEAYPGVALEGKVAVISPTLDPVTRAATVRVVLENAVPGAAQPSPLRPGMFATVELTVGERAAPIVLPEAALVHAGDETFVFVRVGPDTYRRQEVEVEEGAHDVVAVTAGLAAGAEVAVTGTFTLESMARAEELGGGHSH